MQILILQLRLYLSNFNFQASRNINLFNDQPRHHWIHCGFHFFFIAMMPGPLQVDAFVFDGHPKDNSSGPGLKMTAKRYTTACSAQNVGGLTLLFAHCVGARTISSCFIFESKDDPPQLKTRNNGNQQYSDSFTRSSARLKFIAFARCGL